MEEKTIVTTHKYHFVPWVVLLVIAILVWAFLFVHARPHKDYTGYYIYCINAAETKVTYEKYAPKNKKRTFRCIYEKSHSGQCIC